MKKRQSNIAGIGVATAFAASLCCIAPLVALIAGTSGIAGNFQWIEPLRPALIGITVIALGYAWLLQFQKSGQDEDCCDTPKASFWGTRRFLGIVTAFSILMLSFPLYADKLYPNKAYESVEEYSELMQVEFQVDGMTCSGCEGHVEHAIGQLDGIVDARASYFKENALVRFNPAKTNLEEIEEAIRSTSYKVEGYTLVKEKK